MKKKDLTFILGLTLFAAIIWIIVELIMIKLQFPRHFYIIWRVLVVVVTCIISVWHGFKEDDEEIQARQNKYKRKKSKK